LHYVTAREAYNVAKAAEAGCSGDPNRYRDFEVPPPANRKVRCTGPWRLLSWTPQAVSLEVLTDEAVTVEVAGGPLRAGGGAGRRRGGGRGAGGGGAWGGGRGGGGARARAAGGGGGAGGRGGGRGGGGGRAGPRRLPPRGARRRAARHVFAPQT